MNRLLKAKDETQKNKTAAAMKIAKYKPLSPPRNQHIEQTKKYKAMMPRKGQLVVIDVPNVCMECGDNDKFMCAGMQIVIDYYQKVGCKGHWIVTEFLSRL
eukprot:UN32876